MHHDLLSVVYSMPSRRVEQHHHSSSYHYTERPDYSGIEPSQDGHLQAGAHESQDYDGKMIRQY